MPMSVILPSTPILRVQLDHRIDTHNRDTGLNRALQLLDLAHAGLKHAGLDAVAHPTRAQVESVVLVVLLLSKRLFVLGAGGVMLVGEALGQGVAGAQLRDELGTVFRCVDGERSRNYEEGGREGADGELFARALDLSQQDLRADCWGLMGRRWRTNRGV